MVRLQGRLPDRPGPEGYYALSTVHSRNAQALNSTVLYDD